MFRVLTVLLLLSAAAQAQVSADSEEKAYQQAGQLDAIRLQNKFDQMDKPDFMKAFDDYRKDLEIIKKTGRAPDNEALYRDLRQMKNNQKVIYSQNRPQKNKQIYKVY